MDYKTEDVEEDEGRIRKALRRSLVFLLFVIVIVAAALLWIKSNQPEPVPVDEQETLGPQSARKEVVDPPLMRFTNIAKEAGIEFVHDSGAYGERMLPETMGGGVAFLDYDNDGHQDLLFINSSRWPWRPAATSPPTSRLYRNKGDATFEDVTATVGLDFTLYGMGVATGDFDGDGWVDLFISALGENRLLKNIEGKRFVDITRESRLGGAADAWSTSAAFFDFDQDGDLDLFVCNYVGWSPEINREINYSLTGIGRAYGPPTDFSGSDSYLYRNDSGTFTDISADAGIQVANEMTSQPVGKALAVHPVDINGDGWLDILVANDTVRNFLFVNQKNGTFSEVGIELGVAYDNAGSATGAMGIDAAYLNSENSLALAIGNFANEMTSFYVRRSGDEIFSDDAIVAGVGPASRRALTFGLIFVDVDLDGWIDLLTANGHVEPEIQSIQSSQRYAQSLQLFWNCGTRCKRDFSFVGDVAGDFAIPIVGRGAAYADIDSDGDIDMAFTAVGGQAVLLRNDQDLGHHWLRLQLRAESPNVDAVGAEVSVTTAGHLQRRMVMPARSYLSQVELPLTFGLGDADRVEEVLVRWPDGETETWTGLAIDEMHLLEKGSSQALPGAN
jgi:hypothetical protein